MRAFNVTTTAQEIVAVGNRDFVHVYNNSDEVIYVRYDGSASALTTANGMPIPVAGWLILNNDGQRNLFNKAVWGIHGGTGNKEIRIQGDE
jgi:hypothetical protein